MNKTPMPMIAGVINIISGVLDLVGFILVVITVIIFSIVSVGANVPISDAEIATGVLLFASGILLLLGATSLVGGIYALKKKKWGWALAGSISTVISMFPFGVVATVLVAISKKEFEDENQAITGENGEEQ